MIYILGGSPKQTPKENFSGRKALEILIIAFLVALISIAYNIPPAEALAQPNLGILTFLQLLTSTGLIAPSDLLKECSVFCVIWCLKMKEKLAKIMQ